MRYRAVRAHLRGSLARAAWQMAGALLLASVLATMGLPAAHARTVNRIVAIVNDDVITEGDVVAQMTALFEQGSFEGGADPDTHQMRGAVLQHLIQQRLIVQRAHHLGAKVDPEDVLTRLRAIQAELGTEDAYRRMLDEAGLSEEQVKRKLRDQILARQCIEAEVTRKIRVTPSELARASGAMGTPGGSNEEILVDHILIRVTASRSAEEARALINELYERLLGGASFEELARAHSEEPAAEEGGTLGWVRQGTLLPELDGVLWRLETGELSGPVQTRLGFHLVRVGDRRHVSEAEWSDAYQQLKQRLHQEKFRNAMTRWLQGLADDAYIKVINE